MPTRKLDAKFISTATCEGNDRVFYWDAALPGFGLMVTANGVRSFVIQYRNADGVSRRMTIKASNLASAKLEAKKLLGRAADGEDPLADKRQQRSLRQDTLRRIVETEYFTDDEIQKLRTFDEKRYIFEKYIFKPLGSLPITEIKRSNIVRMLRNIKQHNGPGSANNVYKVLSAFFNWYIPKADDDFHSPIVRGVFNQSKGDGARTLTDDEIRILWNVASKGRNPYDQFLQFTLLTATRLSDSANMTRSELSPDGMEWTIPESRYKGQSGKGAHAHLIPLSPLARNVLDSVKVLQVGGKDSQWVFTRDGARPITGFSNFKHSFDRRLFKQLEQEGDDTRNRIVAALNERYPGKNYEPFDDRWTTHSLRKTARTLLDRLGIPESTSEKCLGHLRRGLVKTYNHHEAKPEKKIAFETLAREVERIVSKGGKDNVIRLVRG